MKTEVLNGSDPDALTYAFEVLTSGGLVAFPTDTVYGLGALAFDGHAVKRIYAVKERSTLKAIPVLLGDLVDLKKITLQVPELAATLAAHFWPGPLTLVVPKHPSLPDMISATPTVGVRIPDHPLARALLRLSGPLAVTSANLSGQPSPCTAADAQAQLEGAIPLILDGGQSPGGVPSTVVDCLGTEPKIIREGPITLDQIRKLLGPT